MMYSLKFTEHMVGCTFFSFNVQHTQHKTWNLSQTQGHCQCKMLLPWGKIGSKHMLVVKKMFSVQFSSLCFPKKKSDKSKLKKFR